MQALSLQAYYQKILIFLFCSLGLFLCLFLQKTFFIPSYLASALVGLGASFLPQSKIYNADQATACLYTGSFAAMCSLSFFSNHVDVLILGVFTGIYFIFLSPYFHGFGGKLGAIGFLSSVSFVFLKVIL